MSEATKAMVEAGAEVAYLRNREGTIAWDCLTEKFKQEWRDRAASVIEAALTAAAKEGWQPIETAPRDIEVLLGWWTTWPDRQWKMSSDLAGSTKGGWLHGQATHWQPLPEPPKP